MGFASSWRPRGDGGGSGFASTAAGSVERSEASAAWEERSEEEQGRPPGQWHVQSETHGQSGGGKSHVRDSEKRSPSHLSTGGTTATPTRDGARQRSRPSTPPSARKAALSPAAPSPSSSHPAGAAVRRDAWNGASSG